MIQSLSGKYYVEKKSGYTCMSPETISDLAEFKLQCDVTSLNYADLNQTYWNEHEEFRKKDSILDDAGYIFLILLSGFIGYQIGGK